MLNPSLSGFQVQNLPEFEHFVKVPANNQNENIGANITLLHDLYGPRRENRKPKR